MNLRNNGQKHLKCLVVLTLIQESEKQIIPVNISIIYPNFMHGFGCVPLIQWIKVRALLQELRVKFREISLKIISQTEEAYGICGGLMVCKQKNKG